jgi:hypothetical protein
VSYPDSCHSLIARFTEAAAVVAVAMVVAAVVVVVVAAADQNSPPRHGSDASGRAGSVII